MLLHSKPWQCILFAEAEDLSSHVSFDIVSLQANPMWVLAKFFLFIICSLAELQLWVHSSIFRASFLSLKLNHLILNTPLTQSYILNSVRPF